MLLSMKFTLWLNGIATVSVIRVNETVHLFEYGHGEEAFNVIKPTWNV